MSLTGWILGIDEKPADACRWCEKKFRVRGGAERFFPKLCGACAGPDARSHGAIGRLNEEFPRELRAWVKHLKAESNSLARRSDVAEAVQEGMTRILEDQRTLAAMQRANHPGAEAFAKQLKAIREAHERAARQLPADFAHLMAEEER